MSAKKKQRTIDKVRFSIGTKLVLIISLIVIISLGSITVLVSWLFHADLGISAEEKNLEINHRSAAEAEVLITNIRSSSRILIQTITALGTQRAVIQETIHFFYTENPQIAAVFFITPGRDEQLLVNSRYFTSQGINEGLARSFFNNHRITLGRAVRGETLLQNAAPHFNNAVLALFFPWQNGGAAGVLFSSENLNNNFGFGINQSYMINTDGDILAHIDFSFVKEGANIAAYDFISSILESPDRSKQQLLDSDFGVSLSAVDAADKGFIHSVWNKYVWEKIEPLLKPVIDRSTDFMINAGIIDKKPDEGKIRQFVAFNKLSAAGVIVITSIEYDKVFEGINATTTRNIYLIIAVLCISIILILIFSKSISIPLKSLAAAANKIERGIFEVDLEAKGRDEIGILTNSFQRMNSTLNVFEKFSNKEIALKVIRGEIKPGGLQKHSTILFSDIYEFAAKSEKFSNTYGNEASDKIVNWLNNYFTQMIECVEKTNGVVDKFIGDALMAHWGTVYTAGSPRKDAFNCIKSALIMRKTLYYMNRERRAGDPVIHIGCGINTGIVTAGQLGSDSRMEYTVIGDPVNITSRIKELTKPLGIDILISEDTWDLVGDKFVTEEMPSVIIKGKEKPVRIFAVINFYGEPKGPQSLDDVRSLLGLDPPNLEIADINIDENKYKIGEG